ncbi:hypothetical protein M5689_022590 [Euphorbia peplus]|nr:hypothetical protein M5689_022590 [Euphorbia peplus]
MDYFSILCDEFSCLSTEKQDEELGKLFNVLGGIRTKRHRQESDKDFRNRTFAEGLAKLPEDSEYEGEFFQNRIVPSLIDHFKESTEDTQQKLIGQLFKLTDGLSIIRISEDCKLRYMIRYYSKLLRTILPGFERVMVGFAKGVDKSDEKSDGESDEDDSEEESDDKYTSAPSDDSPSWSFKSKGKERKRDELVPKASSSKLHGLQNCTSPIVKVEWNDGQKKAGLNPNLTFKTKHGPLLMRDPNIPPKGYMWRAADNLGGDPRPKSKPATRGKEKVGLNQKLKLKGDPGPECN